MRSLMVVGALLVAIAAGKAQASVIITLGESGPNVVAAGSGSINLSGLTFLENQPGTALILPSEPEVSVGTGASLDVYKTASSPGSFGSGGLAFADAATGDFIGAVDGNIGVPGGYVSGDMLDGTATWDNATFASLGVTPGTYVWDWGSATNGSADSLTLEVGTVPEPATFTLLATALAGLGLIRRRKRAQ